MSDEIEYSRIPTIMKRYSLESKFLVCTNLSRRYTSPTRPPMENLRDLGVLPHELDAFFMFSIMFHEVGNKNIYEHHGSMIRRIFQSIDNQSIKIIQQGHSDFGNNLMQTYLPPQLQIQENNLILISRHYYYFSFSNKIIDMPTEFFNKFGVDFKDIIGCLQTLSILFTTDKKYNNWGFDKEAYNKIISFFHKKGFLKNFIVQRDDYIKNQNVTSKDDINNFIYCIKYIYQYPFILFDSKLYLPFPHALKQAFTESLLFRLMHENQKLKTNFGKEVFENYIFDLFENTSLYESVSKEQLINKNKLSSDVIIKNNGKIVFVECKTTFPRAGIRIFDRKTEEFTFNFFSNSIMEIYDSIIAYCKKYQVDRKYCYGVLVSAIDDEVSIRLKYEEIKNRHKELTDEDFSFITSHIKTIKLYEIEELCGLSNTPIDELLSNWANNEQQTCDITIESKYIRGSQPLGLLKNLHNQISAISKGFIDELNKEGIITD